MCNLREVVDQTCEKGRAKTSKVTQVSVSQESMGSLSCGRRDAVEMTVQREEQVVLGFVVGG